MDLEKTETQFKAVMAECRDLFARKLRDYGASWRVWRVSSVIDQIYIKANRVRTLETTGVSAVGEGIRPEYVGIINYCLVALIQLREGYAETLDMQPERALALYDVEAQAALELMTRKNRDYNEAWRSMYVSTYTDFVLGRVLRMKEMLSNGGKAEVSEGIDAQLLDMLNYSVFGVIKLTKWDADC